MPEFTFITSNPSKMLAAQRKCEPLGFSVRQEKFDFVEIQSDSGEEITKHKAQQAFNSLKKPLVVSDDTWIIPGLNGFPGPYMKYVNEWFTTEDFIHLTAHLTDRRIILHQIIVYQDKDGQKVFSGDITGELLREPRGESHYSHLMIITYDNGAHSAAEMDTLGASYLGTHDTAWQPLCKWLNTNKLQSI